MPGQPRTFLAELLQRDVFGNPGVRDAHGTGRTPGRFEAHACGIGLWIRVLYPDTVVNVDQHAIPSRSATATVVCPNQPHAGLVVVSQRGAIRQDFPGLITDPDAFSLSAVRAGQSESGVRDMP